MANFGRTTWQYFHYNAFSETFRKARELRKHMTEAEKTLWNEVRNRKLSGLKIRRQHPVAQFIVDFYCTEARLVIEIDGSIHANPVIRARDLNRTAELERLGLKVLRFTNDEVLRDIAGVIEEIRCSAASSPPCPLSKLERGLRGEVK